MFKTYEQVEQFFDQRKQFGIKPGLNRIKSLLAMLDHPEKKTKMIHVAGTNGKGSTINFLKQMLIANGYKVGLFTSPSLDGLTGHIFLNNEKIPKKAFTHLLNDMLPAIQELDGRMDHPTEFEIMTVLAFTYFAKHVDIALIEAGMGGLEDTTNCFVPILSIITTIDKDHIRFLGNTRKEIALHKAGIIKEKVPVIVGRLGEEAMQVVEEVAQDKQASVYRLDQAFLYRGRKQVDKKQQFTWSWQDKQEDIVISMAGEHQVQNASLAWMALHLLKENGLHMEGAKALIGIESAALPGRFERVYENPTIILDGGHNVAGIHAFLATVQMDDQSKDKELIFAAFKDKDLDLMLAELSQVFSTITLTTFDHPRAATSAELVASFPKKEVQVCPNWQEKVDQMIEQESDQAPTYFITGSLHFIAEVRAYIKETKKDKEE